MDMINWAVHANNYSIERGRDSFSCPVLGGLDNRGVMLNGNFEEVEESAHRAAEKYGKKGFVLGADCSIQRDYNVDLIRSAVRSAHEVKFSGS